MSESFDVFLSHNSKDKPTVRQLAQALQARGFKVWLDEEQLAPGRPWQQALEEIIQTTRTAAVLVGKDGLGSWEIPEMRACLSGFVDRYLPVIPVLLPGAPAKPELPLFLRAFTWVDLRGGLTDEGLDRLEWGITGVMPGKGELPKRPQVNKPVGSSQPEPRMNLDNELDAFKKIATGEDTQTRLILVTGEGGMGKSYLLGLYKQVADENDLDVLTFSLGVPPISVENCIDQIVVRFGLEHFNCHDKFLIDNPYKPLPSDEEKEWQRKLTREFFRDLGNYISASPIAIFFDQYEKADPIFKNWLTQIFLPCISVRYPIIVVIAGRESIGLPPSAKGCRHFPLKGVTMDWYHRYVEDCKIKIDSKLINEFHKLIHGRPKEFVEYVKALSQGGL